MRIAKLTPRIEKWLLSRRAQRDLKSHSVAAEIVADVRKRGDLALFAWTKTFDSTDLSRDGVWISRKEFRAAEKRASSDFLNAIKKDARNVRRVAEKQLPRSWKLEVEGGVTITQRVSPLETIGCYIPGGRFALVSRLLITVIPAQVAGVRRIVAVCLKPNSELLPAANMLGIVEIARIGGAQAIAALAYGTKSIPRLEKLFGPGNKYVTAAKQLVSSDCRDRFARGADGSNCLGRRRQSTLDRRRSVGPG
jgi:histidinol dehydrogenase